MLGKDFDTIFKVISQEKRHSFPDAFVQFLGYTIFNAKRYKGNNKWDLTMAHYNFAQQIPNAITTYIASDVRNQLTDDELALPIGDTSIMHSMMTKPAMAQQYHAPIWRVPSLPSLDSSDRTTILGNKNDYEETKNGFLKFANELMARIQKLP